ncbi:hypothetical protein CDAR_460321 [Caerostris darwini]|uniref:Uncharacterized protein n=1 Tax=Caerostris darwini TaxID=1538125 RepID=A0AAV4R6D0_9ARAC|nr:hypothetical protein CDAR_460321 [Caerostris darwini]
MIDRQSVRSPLVDNRGVVTRGPAVIDTSGRAPGVTVKNNERTAGLVRSRNEFKKKQRCNSIQLFLPQENEKQQASDNSTPSCRSLCFPSYSVAKRMGKRRN